MNTVEVTPQGRPGRLRRARRWITAVGAAGTLAAGVVLAAASPAAASGAACNPGCSAYVEFDSYGEILTIHDYSPDGHPTVGFLDLWDGPANGWDLAEIVEDHNGYDGAAVSKNLSFDEGRQLRYRACLGTYDAYWSCSSYRTDTA
jgi:hypothetical protein